MEYAILAGCLVLGYLIGSVNMSLVVGKSMGVDIRKHGSGNAGATNALRTLGKNAAIIILIGDLLKSGVAVLLSMMLAKVFISDTVYITYCIYLSGLGAVIGHNFPVYFGFRGGKGILTSIGFILILDYRIGLIVAAISLLIMFITRYVSLGSVCGAILYPLFVYVFNINSKEPALPAYMALSVIIAALAVYQHRANVARLIAGKESKFGEKTVKENETDKN